jgi:TonB family protein
MLCEGVHTLFRHILAFTAVACSLAQSPLAAQEVSGNVARKLLEKSEPTYPVLARKNALRGAVKLLVTVAPNGKPKDVEVVGGSPVFVQAATDSVNKWKWAEGPQETKVVVQVNFDPNQ